MRNWIRAGAYVLLAIIGIFGWRYIVLSEPLRFGANAIPTRQSVGVIIYGYLVTIAGVVLGSAYRELQARRQLGEKQIRSIKKFTRSIFSSIDLWMSFCGSPLVYAILWRSMDGGSIPALTTIALQNGFCCTVIISSLLAPTQQQNGTDTKS